MISMDANVDSALPLARMVSCFSAKVKREREEFSKTKDSADLLADANKQIDTLTAERDAKATRIAELESSHKRIAELEAESCVVSEGYAKAMEEMIESTGAAESQRDTLKAERDASRGRAGGEGGRRSGEQSEHRSGYGARRA